MIYSLRKSLTTQHFLLSQQEIVGLNVRSNFMAVCLFVFFVLFFQTNPLMQNKLKPGTNENKSKRGIRNSLEQFVRTKIRIRKAISYKISTMPPPISTQAI